MKCSTFAAVLLPILANASVIKRAGGPTAKRIPGTCTVINPLPHASCGTANVAGYQPNPGFVSQHLLYQSYFHDSASAEDQAKQCKQQCYGYGNPGDCKSSFTAMHVPVPQGYNGQPGGHLQTACLLFKHYLSPLDFELVEVQTGARREQYISATAANIYCPSNQS